MSIQQRLKDWVARAVPASAFDLDEPFEAQEPCGASEFRLVTVDRRTWRVRVDPEALAVLSGEVLVTPQAIAEAIGRHLYQLQFAALRVIGRGQTDGELVRLGRAELQSA